MAFSSSSNCVIISQSSARLSTRFQPALTSNPISLRLALSKCKTDELSFRAISEKTPHYSIRDARKSFFVCATTEPEVPPASAPPFTSGISMLRWIIGLLLSIILPFFGLGSKLGVIMNRFENTVQVVENVTEAVQMGAMNVQKIAQDFAGGAPQGKLHDLIVKVEHVASKTAHVAGCLDYVIDEVQGEGHKVDEIAESAIKDAKSTPLEAAAAKVQNEN